MKLSLDIAIDGSREAIWAVISDIENAVDRISGIDKIEIHEKPESGLVGLKWTETRTLFGKSATETMWITEESPNEYYKTRAENHGAIYTSGLRILERDGKNYLEMFFESEPQTFMAKVMSKLMGFMFKKATIKALQQDLDDIKKAVEST
ncbi:MAG: SRPBCC family protein [Bacteroidia bacterium]|nr:SRPBCC family protein [Bacteroidia bacterium]